MLKEKWWHSKVAYQIYPKSFQDSNGDGIGDIPGIISRLDYLKDLGIDIIWISPMYLSPMYDQGYDVADYYQIDPSFGTMEDFDRLLEEAKKRDMHILMDLVVNHCSSEHEWFRKALADPYGKYGDYFFFRKGKDGKTPSNYRSYFGGNVWEPVEDCEDLYYCHFFLKQQPDLNWFNPEVKEKIYEMINWWLDKGLAGFRIDAIINIGKNPDFPDLEPDGADGLGFCAKIPMETPGIGDMLQELKRETFDKYDAFTIGEVFDMREEELEEFIGENGHFSTMFDFTHEIMTVHGRPWTESRTLDLREWRDAMFENQKTYQDRCFIVNIIENHDEPRGVSRMLPEWARNEKGAKMIASISLMLQGLPFLYQGQEIGMRNCVRNSVEEFDDCNTIDQYKVAIANGFSEEEALAVCNTLSRDNARAPMQWTDGENCGFTTGKPWIPMGECLVNVEEQLERKDSVWYFYKALIALRKNPEYQRTIVYGVTVPLWQELPTIFAFERQGEGQSILLAANFGKEPVTLEIPEKYTKILLTNGEKEMAPKITLEPLDTILFA